MVGGFARNTGKIEGSGPLGCKPAGQLAQKRKLTGMLVFMPTDFAYDEPNLSPLIDAWAAHYEAKGCSRARARDLGFKKARLRKPFPPRP